jgi:ABC-2 type transport system permease protein
MELVLANIKNELWKLFLKKKNIFYLIITIMIPLIMAIVLPFFNQNYGINVVNGANFQIFILGVFTNLILPLLIAMISIDMFSGEFREKTIKLLLVQPITRFKIFLSKIASVGVYILLHLLIVFTISLLLSFIKFDHSVLIRSIPNNIKAYIIAFVPMFTIAVASVFVAQFFKSTSGALVFLIVLYTVSKLFPYFSITTAKMFFLYYTDWHLMWLGSVSASTLFSIFILQLSYCLILFSLGFYIFDRKEL